MKRREFIAAVGAATLLGAQRPAPPVVAFVNASTAGASQAREQHSAKA